MKAMTRRGMIEGWYVVPTWDEDLKKCITCGYVTWGRNEYGEPLDFTCYFETLVKTEG